MRADRLLRLLVLLQRHRRLRAATLAQWLEVSERTILRDMTALSAAGVPVYTERGRGGGCVLLEGYTTDASGLTPEEAQAVFAWAGSESASELGLGSALSGALAKIAASASTASVADGEALGAVLHSDRRRWFADSEQVPALPVLREAAVSRRRVRFTYTSRGATAPSRRTVDPYGVVDHAGRWYLVARHRGRLRTYRVSRIDAVDVLAEPVRAVEQRPLADLWAELRGNFEAKRPPPTTMEVQVDAAVAPAFLGVAGAQSATPPAVVRVGEAECWRLTVGARKNALALLLAWAPDVVLLGPPDLLAEVRDRASLLHEMYAE